MPRPVMAKQAIDDINSQKHRRKVDSLAVVRVLRRTHWHSSVDHPVGFAVRKVVACCRDQVRRHFVVGFVLANSGSQVRHHGVSSLLVDSDVGCRSIHLIEVAEEHRPLVDKFGRGH